MYSRVVVGFVLRSNWDDTSACTLGIRPAAIQEKESTATTAIGIRCIVHLDSISSNFVTRSRCFVGSSGRGESMPALPANANRLLSAKSSAIKGTETMAKRGSFLTQLKARWAKAKTR